MLPAEPRAVHGYRETRSRQLTCASASRRTWSCRGETAAAWPLLEESLRESRRLGIRLGESQALGISSRAEAQRDEATSPALSELALESAAIAREVGWAWWEAGQLRSAASSERERGNLGAAERHALRSLELSLRAWRPSEPSVFRRRARDHRRRAWRRRAGRAPLGRCRERGELGRTRGPVGTVRAKSSKRSSCASTASCSQQARAEGRLLSIAAGRRPRAST